MDFEQYRQIKAINATAIKAGAISMKHMHHVMTGGAKEETAAMRWGKLVHKILLEPMEFERIVFVYAGATRRGKDWDAFAAVHDAEWIVKTDELNELYTIKQAVYENFDAKRILESCTPEVTLEWLDDDGGDCKARLDGYSEQYGVVEVKTTSAIQNEAFGRQFVSMKYDLQCGFYSYGASKVMKRDKTPVTIIAIESEPPYDVAVYPVTSMVVGIGLSRALAIAKQYRACDVIGVYDGVSDGIQELLVPSWYGEEEMAMMFANSAASIMED